MARRDPGWIRLPLPDASKRRWILSTVCTPVVLV